MHLPLIITYPIKLKKYIFVFLSNSYKDSKGRIIFEIVKKDYYGGITIYHYDSKSKIQIPRQNELRIWNSQSFFDGANGFMIDVKSRKKRDSRDSVMYEAIESCQTKCKRVFDFISQGNSNEMLVNSNYKNCLEECR